MIFGSSNLAKTTILKGLFRFKQLYYVHTSSQLEIGDRAIIDGIGKMSESSVGPVPLRRTEAFS